MHARFCFLAIPGRRAWGTPARAAAKSRRAHQWAGAPRGQSPPFNPGPPAPASPHAPRPPPPRAARSVRARPPRRAGSTVPPRSAKQAWRAGAVAPPARGRVFRGPARRRRGRPCQDSVAARGAPPRRPRRRAPRRQLPNRYWGMSLAPAKQFFLRVSCSLSKEPHARRRPRPWPRRLPTRAPPRARAGGRLRGGRRVAPRCARGLAPFWRRPQPRAPPVLEPSERERERETVRAFWAQSAVTSRSEAFA